MLTIIAKIKVKPGSKHYHNVLSALKKVTPSVLQEDGCFLYELLVNHDGQVAYQTPLENTLIMIEKWQSIEHLNKHLETPHMQAYQREVKDDVLDMKINILERAFNEG